jgi:hypothetical protein
MPEDHRSRRGRRSPLTLSEIQSAIEASWRRDTCDELDEARWTPANPSLGQCAATAYVIHDLLGGRLLGAEVRNPDGSLQGHHYWNLLEGGIEVDLTLGQFSEGERVQVPEVMDRIHATPSPGADRYLILRDRVRQRLALRGLSALSSQPSA